MFINVFPVFISEGGQECFEDKREAIQECSKTVFGTELNLHLDNVTNENMPQLTFDVSFLILLIKESIIIIQILYHTRFMVEGCKLYSSEVVDSKSFQCFGHISKMTRATEKNIIVEHFRHSIFHKIVSEIFCLLKRYYRIN